MDLLEEYGSSDEDILNSSPHKKSLATLVHTKPNDHSLDPGSTDEVEDGVVQERPRKLSKHQQNLEEQPNQRGKRIVSLAAVLPPHILERLMMTQISSTTPPNPSGSDRHQQKNNLAVQQRSKRRFDAVDFDDDDDEINSFTMKPSSTTGLTSSSVDGEHLSRQNEQINSLISDLNSIRPAEPTNIVGSGITTDIKSKGSVNTSTKKGMAFVNTAMTSTKSATADVEKIHDRPKFMSTMLSAIVEEVPEHSVTSSQTKQETNNDDVDSDEEDDDDILDLHAIEAAAAATSAAIAESSQSLRISHTNRRSGIMMPSSSMMRKNTTPIVSNEASTIHATAMRVNDDYEDDEVAKDDDEDNIDMHSIEAAAVATAAAIAEPSRLSHKNRRSGIVMSSVMSMMRKSSAPAVSTSLDEGTNPGNNSGSNSDELVNASKKAATEAFTVAESFTESHHRYGASGRRSGIVVRSSIDSAPSSVSTFDDTNNPPPSHSESISATDRKRTRREMERELRHGNVSAVDEYCEQSNIRYEPVYDGSKYMPPPLNSTVIKNQVGVKVVPVSIYDPAVGATVQTIGGHKGSSRSNQINHLLSSAANLEMQRVRTAEAAVTGTSNSSANTKHRANAKRKYGW